MRRKRPRVIDQFKRAVEWQRMIDAGEVKNAAQISRDLGITRARVCQLLSLLRLESEIKRYIIDLEGDEGCLHLSARALINIATSMNRDQQLAAFSAIVGVWVGPTPPTSPCVVLKGIKAAPGADAVAETA